MATAGTPREKLEPVTGPILTLVELPPRRAEFLGNLRAALKISGSRLPFEDRLGHVSPRWMGASTLVHILVLILWLILPQALPRTAVIVPQEQPKYDVVYYHAQALPQMEDAGGSMAGQSGKGGGQEAFHPTQVIRISRAPTLLKTVVDEPKMTLPRVAGPTANIVSLAAMPAPSVPVLAPQPVTVQVTPTDSRIKRSTTATSKADLRVTAGQMPSLVQPPVSAVARPAPPSPVTLPPAPRPALPAKKEIATAVSQGQEISLASVTPVPAAATAAEPNASGGGGAMQAQSVVVSTNPGDAVGAPANGAPGSLAMSPKGRAEAGIGGEGGGAGIAKGAGPGSGTAGTGPGAGASGAGPGASPTASNGTSLSPGPGGSGNGGKPAIPGVVIRGGVVSLGSFGPKQEPGKKSVADPPRKSAAITVIATGRSGGGLNAYGTFKSQQVYTIYVDTKAGPVVLQFAGREAPGSYNGDLTPPDPVSTDVPPLPAGGGVVLACILDAAGRVQNIRVLHGAVEASQVLVQAVRTWRFHPVLSSGQPVAVDALIGIGMGVN